MIIWREFINGYYIEIRGEVTEVRRELIVN